MRKKLVVTTIIMLVSITTLLIITFTPRPIADNGIEEIITVEANWNYGQENSTLSKIHFIPDRVEKCISKYKEQRTLSIHRGYAMKNVKLRIMIRTNKGVKNIIIGKDTYSRNSSGLDYMILGTKEFEKEIFDICGYTEK